MSVNGGASIGALVAGGGYTFDLEFTSTSAFNLDITGSNTISTSGTKKGAGTAIGALQLGFAQGPGADYGDILLVI